MFGIGVGARAVGGAEENGTLALVLAQPVPRSRLVVERYVAMVGLVAGLGAVAVLPLAVLGPTVGLLDGVPAVRLLVAYCAVVALALLHATLAYATGCAVGRRAPASRWPAPWPPAATSCRA